MLRAFFAGLLLISALISEGSFYLYDGLLENFNSSDGSGFAILENNENNSNDIDVKNEIDKNLLPAGNLKYVLQAALHKHVFIYKNGIELAKIDYAESVHLKKYFLYSIDRNIAQSDIKAYTCGVGYFVSIYGADLELIIDSEVTFSQSDISPPGIKRIC